MEEKRFARPRRATSGLLAWVVVAVSVLGTNATAPARASADGDQRPGVVDPSETGRFPVDQLDYKGGRVVLQDQYGAPVVEELKGSIHLPDHDSGPWPLIVFMHGRHATCRALDRIELIFATSPCPELDPLTSDIPSYRGYDYLAHNLASHGYVVVSASANGINSYDFPASALDAGMEWRAQLVGETIDLIAGWNERRGPREVGDRLIDAVDLSRIGLMGHSRGGEGVARFVLSNKTRTTGPTYEGLRAVFALAPTDFYAEKVPGVHFGTIVPLCDGDVYNLQGAWMFDDARFLKPQRFARIQFAVEGANHNFFNTVWTYDDGVGGGDDTGNNPACNPKRPGNVRLSAREQRSIGLDLMAAFFRRYLGGDKELEPLMTGAATVPAGHCPRRCDDVALTSYIGPGAHLVLRPQPDEKAKTSGGVKLSYCKPALNGRGCPSAPNRSPAEQVTIGWDGRGLVSLPLKDLDASGFSALTFRTAINFTDMRNLSIPMQDFGVRLVDRDGRTAEVDAADYSRALRPPAGSEHQQMLLNGVRIPLNDLAGIDLAHLSQIELVFGESRNKGSIQLAEVAFQEPR